MKTLSLFLIVISSISILFATDIPRAVDVSIGGIKLGDPKSSEAVLGKDIKTDSGIPYSRAQYENIRRTQKLVLIHHPGDDKNSFSEFEVLKINKSSDLPVLELKSFVSGKGIEIGMPKKEVTKILGEPSKVEKKGKTLIFFYFVEQKDEPEFFKKYNLPFYISKYAFIRNKLIKFSFGFAYP